MEHMPLAGPHIEGLRTYVPDKPLDELAQELGLDEIIKLSSNESLMGPSPKAVEALREEASRIFYYPDGGTAGQMHRAIADFHNIAPEQLITANGSNEILTLIARTFCEAGVHSVLTFDFGFIIYALVSRAHNVEVRTVPMGEDFDLNLQAMAEAVDESTKVVFIANPNNPTGTYAPAKQLRQFIEAVPPHVIVVIDEAYFEYAQVDDYASALHMRDLRQRLIVLRSFSKCYGMAGVRAGYAVAPAPLIERMNRVREPFTCNSLAQASVPAALADQDWIQRTLWINEVGRVVLEEGLADLADMGVSWTPSQTNFLLVELPRDSQQVADAMVRQGVLVRPMKGYGLDRHLRIALADRPIMERCVDALRNAL